MNIFPLKNAFGQKQTSLLELSKCASTATENESSWESLNSMGDKIELDLPREQKSIKKPKKKTA